jgi:hypothetical protein
MSRNNDLVSLIETSRSLLDRDVLFAKRTLENLNTVFYSKVKDKNPNRNRIDRFSNIEETTPSTIMNSLSRLLSTSKLDNIKLCLVTNDSLYFSYNEFFFEKINLDNKLNEKNEKILIFVDLLSLKSSSTFQSFHEYLNLYSDFKSQLSNVGLVFNEISDPLAISASLGLRPCYLYPILGVENIG